MNSYFYLVRKEKRTSSIFYPWKRIFDIGKWDTFCTTWMYLSFRSFPFIRKMNFLFDASSRLFLNWIMAIELCMLSSLAGNTNLSMRQYRLPASIIIQPCLIIFPKNYKDKPSMFIIYYNMIYSHLKRDIGFAGISVV